MEIKQNNQLEMKVKEDEKEKIRKILQIMYYDIPIDTSTHCEELYLEMDEKPPSNDPIYETVS